jgi:hypothetical protein
MAGAPFISDTAREGLLRLATEGHELGLAPFDAVRWHDEAAHADRAWTERQIRPGLDIYRRMFRQDPTCFGANGMQVNPFLFDIESDLELKFASDVLGQTAFLPRAQRVDGEVPQLPVTLPSVAEALHERGVNEDNPRAQRVDGEVPQLPVTLPSVAEALHERGVNEDNVHEHIFDASQKLLVTGHVWRIDAEADGIDFIDVVEKMIVMWRGSQRELGPVGERLAALDLAGLRRHQIGWQRDAEGGYVAAQSVAAD